MSILCVLEQPYFTAVPSRRHVEYACSRVTVFRISANSCCASSYLIIIHRETLSSPGAQKSSRVLVKVWFSSGYGWFCSGSFLVRALFLWVCVWSSSGSVLALCRFCSGSSLATNPYKSFGVCLVKFWFSSGLVPVLFWFFSLWL